MKRKKLQGKSPRANGGSVQRFVRALTALREVDRVSSEILRRPITQQQAGSFLQCLGEPSPSNREPVHPSVKSSCPARSLALSRDTQRRLLPPGTENANQGVRALCSRWLEQVLSFLRRSWRKKRPNGPDQRPRATDV